MAVITFSRQLGSGGDEIAKGVCEALSYQYFDKRMLVAVASRGYRGAEQIRDYHEDNYKRRSLLDRLRGWRPTPTSLCGPAASLVGAKSASGSISEHMLVWLVDAAVRAAYEKGRLVILGRAGQVILMDKPGVLHVRVEAPVKQRVDWIAEHQKISQDAARLMVNERDRSAAEYLRRFYGANWADPLLYHLIINTGRWDIATAVSLVEHAVRHLAEQAPQASENQGGELCGRGS